MKKLAHITHDSREQTLSEHLENVSKLAEKFAKEPFKDIAKAAGAAHDIGKNAQAFQARLHGSKEKFEHSACGAIEIQNLQCGKSGEVIKPLLEYCIAGHHTGLPDGGTDGDSADGSATLKARLKRADSYTGKSDYHGSEDYMKLSLPDVTEFLKLFDMNDRNGFFEKYAFFTRYVFSCLTDADYLDTETFCSPGIIRGTSGDTEKMYVAVKNKLGAFKAETELQKCRAKIQQQALSNLDESCDISILNMPTGSGKTLCSLMLALEMIKRSCTRLKRIIYVIPYTSIIEQTADVFEKIIGKYTDIVQHHSNYFYDDPGENDSAESKLKKACENWDAPVIITTSVQFFESLYHYKSSRLRKLHNLADSVIVFDEIHLLPVDHIQPCLKGVGYITKYLGSKAIFLSATMPNYDKLFAKYIPECRAKHLITDRSDFSSFEKCLYHNLGEQTLEGIAEKASSAQSSLIVVNSRKSARNAFNLISGNKYHLSTYMTPHDRKQTIKKIRDDLENGRKVCVVSTSLIEAGVDLDFETVFRQTAGLDSILQSGGRCNREGKRDKGDVYFFSTDEKLNGDIALRANITNQLAAKYDNINDKLCIEEYFDRLFKFKEKDIECATITSKEYFHGSISSFAFREYANSFEFIKDETVSVVIDNCKETTALLERAAELCTSANRMLQSYSVSLRLREFSAMLRTGRVRLHQSGLYVLDDPNDYSSEIGLLLDRHNDMIVI